MEIDSKPFFEQLKEEKVKKQLLHPDLRYDPHLRAWKEVLKTSKQKPLPRFTILEL